MKEKREILYIDMDGVIADYESDMHLIVDDIEPEHFFLNLKPIPNGIDSVKKLSKIYDIYILSTAPWKSIHSLSEKRQWIENHLGACIYKKLILTHNKGLLRGEYLIDDRIVNGVKDFQGKHLHFGQSEFPNWDAINKYFNI